MPPVQIHAPWINGVSTRSATPPNVKTMSRSYTYRKDDQRKVPFSCLTCNQRTRNRRSNQDRDSRDGAVCSKLSTKLLHRYDLASRCGHDGDEDARGEAIEAGEGYNGINRRSGKPHRKTKESREKKHRVEKVEATIPIRRLSAAGVTCQHISNGIA